MTLAMDIPALHVFMRQAFPQVADDFCVDRLEPDGLTVRMLIADRHLRPGGTVSGPSMFALADVSIYLAILSRIGPVALAVTTNCSIDFMRKPESGRDLFAEARLLKLGRTLAVGDVLLRSDGSDAIVARAGLTYSIPPKV
ncbi:uncharacterized domain 1-containing protein [Gemmobacter megaterium]|uniref:Uncharacterized domain 1-containing protein n=1 Tax=Gemmobacter megaterium TaxID=1086013 RepID=A0A1N7PYY3_9RHOB|nr:PaaI family thioesterase [Gemmobacter megaterium]SIT15577.1 uncharacterized domain 1-containing protein [Gemmobacter megaterium]